MPLSEVDRLRRHQHPHVGRRHDHATAFTARSTAASVLASTPPCRRTDGVAKHDLNQAASKHGRRNWRFCRRFGRTVMGDHHRRKGRRSLLEPGRLTFAKPIPPSEQLLRSKTMTASDSRNHDPVLAALRDDRQLLFVSPIPTALNAGDHFDPRPSRGLGFKSTVNLMVKSMDAHGRASCPHARQRERWGQSIAYNTGG